MVLHNLKSKKLLQKPAVYYNKNLTVINVTSAL